MAKLGDYHVAAVQHKIIFPMWDGSKILARAYRKKKS